MTIVCNSCRIPASLEKPLFVRFKCQSCSAKWYECEACENKVVNPNLTNISGCSLCLPTLARVQFDVLRDPDDDIGVEGQYAVDLRNSVDVLKSDFLKKIQGNHFIPSMVITIVGCNKKNFRIVCDGPVEDYKVKKFEPDKFNNRNDLAGNGLFFCDGYQIRIWAISSEIQEKSTWSWIPVEGVSRYEQPLLGTKFLWIAGLTLEEMLDTVFTTAKTLHDYGYHASNHDTTPYPIHVKSQEYTASWAKDWDEDFTEYWICSCNVANHFPASECEGCGVNLASGKSTTQIRSRHISSDVKKQVYERDNGACVVCGSNEELEFDHIIPFSKGGSSTKGNIQLLCLKHNRKKGNKIQ